MGGLFNFSNWMGNPEKVSVQTIKPLPAFDWIVPNTIALGRNPIEKDYLLFQAAGISVVFSLCSEQEGPLPVSFKERLMCQRLVLPDSHVPHPLRVEQLDQAVENLRQLVEQNHRVYLHCLAGVERSPIVGTAYLSRYHRLSIDEALDWVKQVHPPARPTPGQIQVLRAFAARA